MSSVGEVRPASPAARPVPCEGCGTTLTPTPGKRPRRYCGEACRSKARRLLARPRAPEPKPVAAAEPKPVATPETGVSAGQTINGRGGPQRPQTQNRRSEGVKPLPTTTGTAPGLVICPITAREFLVTPSDLGFWKPGFPSAELVRQAAEFLPERDKWDGHEGPRPRIMIGPGAITVSRPDLARHERAAQRQAEQRRRDVDYQAAYLVEHGELPPGREPSREIVAWSGKSRSNFVHVLCELDYAPMFTDPSRIPAMATLTYSGDWLTVAPDGKTVKGHLRMFRWRYERAWGECLICLWKLEFQFRGAPHFHLLLVPPHGKAGEHRKARQRVAVGDGMLFREWLSATWADIVAHPDPVERMKHEAAGTGLDYAEGLRASDPKKVAVYFLKHGGASAKEYQHIVPEPWREPGKGPGRFWGFWGLEKVVAGREVEPRTAVLAARILRRWARAQGTTKQVQVPRVNTRTGEIRLRTVRRPVRRMRGGTGWVAVNDGAGFGSALGRFLTQASV